MQDNPTIVNLADVRSGTTTSTSSASTSSGQGSQSQPAQQYFQQPTTQPAPSEPDGKFETYAIWVVIAFIIGWLAWLSNAFYTESKELNNKISDNQKQVMQSMSEYQMDLKNQISDFERRHEVDMRELQKMILQSHNSSQKATTE